MVPWLEEAFQSVNPLRERAIELSRDIERADLEARSNGGAEVGGVLDEQRRSLKQTTDQIEAQVRTIHERGVLVKDIEQGLVDFPAERDGREVYLCWRAGEAEVAFWHETSTGFSGRQPL